MLQRKINHADQKTAIPNNTVIKRLWLIELKLYELYQSEREILQSNWSSSQLIRLIVINYVQSWQNMYRAFTYISSPKTEFWYNFLNTDFFTKFWSKLKTTTSENVTDYCFSFRYFCHFPFERTIASRSTALRVSTHCLTSWRNNSVKLILHNTQKTMSHYHCLD